MGQSSLGIPRHWWGKIIGAAIGLLRGGLTGAILGGFIGHLFDRFMFKKEFARRSRENLFRALFSTLGHISKADGRVTEREIAAAEELMARLQLTPGERQDAIRCFRLGKEPGFDLEGTLHAFARHTVVRHDLRLMLVEILLNSAASDGGVSQAEQAVLLRVCRALHIPAEMFSAMWNARQAGPGQWQYQGARGSAGASRQQVPLRQAYATLGLEESATDAEVKRAYRKLVGQYHPDKLVSQGLPEEMMEVAKKRVREINTAYDQVKQTRGFK
jgi:DnaJ like chaperone protein